MNIKIKNNQSDCSALIHKFRQVSALVLRTGTMNIKIEMISLIATHHTQISTSQRINLGQQT